MFHHKHLLTASTTTFWVFTCNDSVFGEQEEARAAEMLRAQEVGFGENLPIFRGFFGEVGVKRSKFGLIFGDSFLNEKVGEV